MGEGGGLEGCGQFDRNTFFYLTIFRESVKKLIVVDMSVNGRGGGQPPLSETQ